MKLLSMPAALLGTACLLMAADGGKPDETAVGRGSTTGGGVGRIVITEIMYNPASDERQGETEWVEIANVGDAAVNLDGWHLDDEDAGTWGPLKMTLEPGEVAVIINAVKLDEAKFRAAWDQPVEGRPVPDYKIAAVRWGGSAGRSGRVGWGGLANDPTHENEILQLLDSSGGVVCEVNYERTGDWPRADGASIWLNDVRATDLNDGRLWRLSLVGDGVSRACVVGEIFNKPDVGSPGVVPGLNVTLQPPVMAKPEESVTPPAPPGNKDAKPKEGKQGGGIPY